LSAEDVAGFDIYFSFTGGPMLQALESDFGAQRARPLYCSFDPCHYRRRESNRYRCDLSYMGTYAPDRQPKIDDLLVKVARELPQKRFIVAGPQYPKTVRWPKNVQRIQHLNPRWHPHLYSSSRFTLNVTRRDMVQAGYSPSVRLFEAAACGATIISDNWAGLDTFFTPGSEILVPQNGADVKDFLLNLSQSELRRIGDSAQQKALQSHTCDARAREFEAAVEEVLSAPAQRKPIKLAERETTEVFSTRA
jgi:spore maturation protein CgeB